MARVFQRYPEFPGFRRPPEAKVAGIELEIPDLEHIKTDDAIEYLFSVEENPERERHEFAELLLLYKQKLAELRDRGKNVQLGKTIQEMFSQNQIEKALIVGDGAFTLLPREAGSSLILFSDDHGYRQGVERAIREFLNDSTKHHVASLGDNINIGPDQVAIMKALLKLGIAYPDRIHLHPGNHEAFYEEYMEHFLKAGSWPKEKLWRFQINKAHGNDENVKSSLRLFKQLPLILLTENGLVALHGNLPGPIKREGKADLEFRGLRELADYTKGSRRSGRSLFRLLEGEKSKHGEKGLKDLLHPHEVEEYQLLLHYYGEQAIIGALDAIGGSVEIVGHQHSFGRKFGVPEGHPGYAITHDGRVGTMTALPNEGDGKREGAIAKIPLDQPLEKLEENFFIPIRYDQ